MYKTDSKNKICWCVNGFMTNLELYMIPIYKIGGPVFESQSLSKGSTGFGLYFYDGAAQSLGRILMMGQPVF